jgi:hypothetical protein
MRIINNFIDRSSRSDLTVAITSKGARRSSHSPFAALPQARSIPMDWDRCCYSTNDNKCSQSLMSSQVFVYGNANDGHYASCDISDESDESQGPCRSCLVTVNDVHGSGHEDTDIAEAHQSRFCQRGPDRDRCLRYNQKLGFRSCTGLR